MWLYQGVEFNPDNIADSCGFVYLITNNLTGRKYIGKKLFVFQRRKKVKGRTKKFVVNSDWLTYYGSNEELNRDVTEFGSENFTREIIRLCKTKSECNYYEAWEQFTRHVLLDPDYYNSWIRVRITGAHLGKNKKNGPNQLT